LQNHEYQRIVQIRLDCELDKNIFTFIEKGSIFFNFIEHISQWHEDLTIQFRLLFQILHKDVIYKSRNLTII